jgi:hypothetical protein
MFHGLRKKIADGFAFLNSKVIVGKFYWLQEYR